MKSKLNTSASGKVMFACRRKLHCELLNSNYILQLANKKTKYNRFGYVSGTYLPVWIRKYCVPNIGDLCVQPISLGIRKSNQTVRV